MTCPNCGSEDFERSVSRCDTICTGCGTVLEENGMVNELQFGESAGGAAHVVGQFVSATGGGMGFGSRFGGFGNREGRALTIDRGVRRISHIASALRMSQPLQDAAVRIFTLAAQRNFTRGRKTTYVAAACLYIVARRERTPHLLIDFADALQTPVSVLGQTYMKLVRLLQLEVPLVDPSLFAERFAARLELGKDVHAVAICATRLIQSMNRDWLATGRRPAGLCGAALLIASRFHGYSISAQQVANVVRMSASTLKKRLSEFKTTPIAKLSREEFAITDIESLQRSVVPPAFVRTQIKRALEAAELLGTDFLPHKLPPSTDWGLMASAKSVVGKVKSLTYGEDRGKSALSNGTDDVHSTSTMKRRRSSNRVIVIKSEGALDKKNKRSRLRRRRSEEDTEDESESQPKSKHAQTNRIRIKEEEEEEEDEETSSASEYYSTDESALSDDASPSKRSKTTLEIDEGDSNTKSQQRVVSKKEKPNEELATEDQEEDEDDEEEGEEEDEMRDSDVSDEEDFDKFLMDEVAREREEEESRRARRRDERSRRLSTISSSSSSGDDEEGDLEEDEVTQDELLRPRKRATRKKAESKKKAKGEAKRKKASAYDQQQDEDDEDDEDEDGNTLEDFDSLITFLIQRLDVAGIEARRKATLGDVATLKKSSQRRRQSSAASNASPSPATASDASPQSSDQILALPADSPSAAVITPLSKRLPGAMPLMMTGSMGSGTIGGGVSVKSRLTPFPFTPSGMQSSSSPNASLERDLLSLSGGSSAVVNAAMMVPVPAKSGLASTGSALLSTKLSKEKAAEVKESLKAKIAERKKQIEEQKKEEAKHGKGAIKKANNTVSSASTAEGEKPSFSSLSTNKEESGDNMTSLNEILVKSVQARMFLDSMMKEKGLTLDGMLDLIEQKIAEKRKTSSSSSSSSFSSGVTRSKLSLAASSADEEVFGEDEDAYFLFGNEEDDDEEEDEEQNQMRNDAEDDEESEHKFGVGGEISSSSASASSSDDEDHSGRKRRRRKKRKSTREDVDCMEALLGSRLNSRELFLRTVAMQSQMALSQSMYDDNGFLVVDDNNRDDHTFNTRGMSGKEREIHILGQSLLSAASRISSGLNVIDMADGTSSRLLNALEIHKDRLKSTLEKNDAIRKEENVMMHSLLEKMSASGSQQGASFMNGRVIHPLMPMKENDDEEDESARAVAKQVKTKLEDDGGFGGYDDEEDILSKIMMGGDIDEDDEELQKTRTKQPATQSSLASIPQTQSTLLDDFVNPTQIDPTQSQQESQPLADTFSTSIVPSYERDLTIQDVAHADGSLDYGFGSNDAQAKVVVDPKNYQPLNASSRLSLLNIRGSIPLDDVDDEELHSWLLTEEESEVKQMIWFDVMRKFQLPEMLKRWEVAAVKRLKRLQTQTALAASGGLGSGRNAAGSSTVLLMNGGGGFGGAGMMSDGSAAAYDFEKDFEFMSNGNQDLASLFDMGTQGGRVKRETEAASTAVESVRMAVQAKSFRKDVDLNNLDDLFIS